MLLLDKGYQFPDKFVVTGTDTGVGKTMICAMLTHMLGGSYWKPIQSGSEGETDTDFVREVCQMSSDRFLKEEYLLKKPLAPSLAAELEGVHISMDNLNIPDCAHGPLIIEGVGGVLVPLNDKHTFIDLLDKWKLPVLIVVRSTLGTINHTLLTLNALRDRDLPIMGVVMNGPKNDRNRDAIAKWGNVPIIGEMHPVDDLKEYCKEMIPQHAKI